MHHGSGGAAALAALLALVAACGACDGLASGALYGEAAMLAPRYTQALATGNSLSGGLPPLLLLARQAVAVWHRSRCKPAGTAVRTLLAAR